MAATVLNKGSSRRRTAEAGAVAEHRGPGGDVAVVEIDDILGEIGAPAKVEADGEAAYSLDDILGDFDAPPPAAIDDGLDDFLSDTAPPEPVERQDDALATLPLATADGPDQAPGGPAVPAGTGKDTGPGEALDAASPELPSEPSPEQSEAVDSADPADEMPETVQAGRHLPGFSGLSGTRQISRKGHLALIGMVALFGLTAAGEGAFIVAHGVGHSDAKPKRVVVTMAPVDYARIDLTRYIGKRRALHEGGRDVLRNGAVKSAVLELDNGEDLYRELRDIARHSTAADRMAIGDDRLTVASCDTGTCGDKSFRLVYDLVRKQASVCMTEKYLNNSLLSYSYSDEGYSEVASCR